MENKVRMNLIVTPKSLAKIPEHADGTLSFGSMIFVLYESGETCKVEDIANAQQTKATLVETVYSLAGTAKKYLKHVFVGNC